MYKGEDSFGRLEGSYELYKAEADTHFKQHDFVNAIACFTTVSNSLDWSRLERWFNDMPVCMFQVWIKKNRIKTYNATTFNVEYDNNRIYIFKKMYIYIHIRQCNKDYFP